MLKAAWAKGGAGAEGGDSLDLLGEGFGEEGAGVGVGEDVAPEGVGGLAEGVGGVEGCWGVEDGDGAAAFVGEEGDVVGAEEVAVAREAEGAWGGAEELGEVGGVLAGGVEVDGAVEVEEEVGGDGNGLRVQGSGFRVQGGE